MTKEYDAIVVGGGIAGLTCAAFLSSKGYKTLLFEKNNKTGGLVNSFSYKGYVFDAGIRAFENSGILFPMLKSLGIEMNYKKSIVSIGIGDKLTKIESKDSLEKYLEMLTSFFPNNKDEIKNIGNEISKVMGYMNVLYGIDNPLFVDNMDLKYLRNTLLPWYVNYLHNINKVTKLTEPIDMFLQRYTSNIELIDMITQHFFKDTPAFFALSYFSLYLDYNYPEGGTGTLVTKMNEFIISKGGEIMTDASITNVDVNNHKIIFGDDIYQYKKLVWAADQRTLYRAAKNYQSAKVDKLKDMIEKSVGSDSLLTLFLGVNQNQEYFEKHSGSHIFYTPKTFGLSKMDSWRDIVNDKEALKKWIIAYLENTTYEISIPSLRYNNLAPVGKTGVIVSTILDYHLVKELSNQGWYEEFKNICSLNILNVLNNSIFPNFTNNVEFNMCSTPLTIEKETGNTHGAIVGWSFSNKEMPSVNNFKKIMKSIKTPFKDIYQSGQWSYSPGGLPVSVLTSKFAANAVIKALK